jgi:hypothetical protein
MAIVAAVALLLLVGGRLAWHALLAMHGIHN